MRTTDEIYLPFFFTLVTFMAFTNAASAAEKLNSEPCRSLSKLITQPEKFSKRVLRSFPDERTAFSAKDLMSDSIGLVQEALCVDVNAPGFIPNVDVDGDGTIDVIYFSCPGGGSRMKADRCEMSVEFGHGGRLALPDYFSFVLHRSSIYAIYAELGFGRTPGSGKAYRITREGMTLVCSHL